MASIIEEIKANVDIVDYIEEYVPLTLKGKNYVGLCPFHEDSDPSFKVSPDKGIFKCFGCGKGGNIFNFVTLYHKVDFGEAIRILSMEIGVEEEDTYSDHYKQMAAWHEYFKNNHNEFSRNYLDSDREIPDNIYEEFEVGFTGDASQGEVVGTIDPNIPMSLGVVYVDKQSHYRFKFPGCLTFPFFDDQDRVVGFSFMRIHRRDDEPKYENSWTTPIFKRRELFFGLKQMRDKIKGTGCAYLTEGYFDVMRMYQTFHDRGTIAICGSSMTDEQVSKIKKYCHRVEIHFDGDVAGRDGAIKSAFKCEEAGLETWIADIADGEDPDSYYEKDGRVQVYSVPTFFKQYKGENADGADELISHASKIKDLDIVEYYIKAVNEMYPNIPKSLITARMSQTYVISTKYKLKDSEFSIQKELIKAMLLGHLSPVMFDETKFTGEYKVKVTLLKGHKDTHGFINLDSSIMTQFSEFLEPLNVAVEELPKLALPYREYQDIGELIRAKKELHK
jgi:DNA primase catalytic core